MKRLIIIASACLFMASPSFAGQLPASDMENLTGEVVHLPSAFTGNPNLVILAFSHEQRAESGRVAALLQEAQSKQPTLQWYELPIIDAPAVAQFFIKNGMRNGTIETLHEHIVPQFVDEDNWRSVTGIHSADALLAKVSADGTILTTVRLTDIRTVSDIYRQ